MKFNYYNYKKNMTLKHSVKILDGGLLLKAESAATATGDDGNPIDYALAEVQDELVNLMFTQNLKLSDISNVISNKSDNIVRFKGQKVGSDIDKIKYDQKSNPPTAYIVYDKNADVEGAVTEDLVSYALEAAHKLMGEASTIDTNYNITSIMKSHINNYVFIDFNALTDTTQYNAYIDELGDNYISALLGNPALNDIYVTISNSGNPVLNGEFKVISYNKEVKNTDGDVIYYNGLVIDAPSIYSAFPLGDLVNCVALKLTLGSINKPYIDRKAFSICNMWSTVPRPGKNFGSDNKSSPAISRKAYRKKLKDLRDRLMVHGIDVVSTEYIEDLEEITDFDPTTSPYDPRMQSVDGKDSEGNKTTTYYRDNNYSYLHRQYKKGESVSDVITTGVYTALFGPVGLAIGLFSDDKRNANFTDSKHSSDYFINDKKIDATLSHPELASTHIDDLSPFDASFKEVVTCIYGSIDELRTELIEFINDLHDHAKLGPIGIFDMDEIRGKILDHRPSEALESMRETARTGLAVGALGVVAGGLVFGAMTAYAFYKSLDRYADRFSGLIDTIDLVEYYAGESLLDDGCYFNRQNAAAKKLSDGKLSPVIDYGFYKHQARLLIPVDIGHKKVKYRSKNMFGQTVTKTRKKDLGVRWCSVRFVNAFIYDQFRKSEIVTGVQVPVDADTYPLNWSIASITQNKDELISYYAWLKHPVKEIDTTLTLTVPQYEADPGTKIFFQVYDSATAHNKSKYATMWSGTVLSPTSIAFKTSVSFIFSAINTNTLTIRRIIKPYAPSQPNPNPIPCRIEYRIPHLPSDSIIRDYAFSNFGPFDQGEYAIRWNEFKQLKITGTTKEDIQRSIEEFENTNPRIAGFNIFHDTSDAIESLRSGIDIYNKVQFLNKLLVDVFGESRVTIIETMRSYEDQDILQLGGDSSNFLSWHNYGLSIKIDITEENGITLIRDGSSDFFKLFRIAEAFTDGALNGYFGSPCNVVWCGRLVTGPNIFVWEFLPIGVNHKDSIKFRDAAYNQLDPVEVNSYVDATDYVVSGTTNAVEKISIPPTEAALDTAINLKIATLSVTDYKNDSINDIVDDIKYIMRNADTISQSMRLQDKTSMYRNLCRMTRTKTPYIYDNSPAYKNAIVMDGKRWVAPTDITNYPVHRNLIMKDIQEFFFMIRRKFMANGSALSPGQRVIDWKNSNPISFNQLILFNSMLGKYSIVRSLLSCDYTDKFSNISASANLNPVAFVKNFLGYREYTDIHIYPDGIESDSGYITLHDGKLSLAVMQCRSIKPEGHGNMFGEEQSDLISIEFGQVQNGVFVPEFPTDPITGEYKYDPETGKPIKNHMDLIKSANAVITGYAPDGTVIPPEGITLPNKRKIPAGDAYMLHVIIKDKILDELNIIKKQFNDLSTQFLHDYHTNSPKSKELLENEFGVIQSQDLMSFDELMDMYRKMEINDKAGNDGIGGKRGVGINITDIGGEGDETYANTDRNRDQSVYEKLVSTTQLTGIQFSKNGKEKPKIEPLINKRLETILTRLQGDSSPTVADIL